MRNNETITMINRTQSYFVRCLSGLVLLTALSVSSNFALAKINVSSDGVAVHGYDAVAYFLEGRAARGTSEIEHLWQGAKWQFASEANKKLFAADPVRYAPQYGGFCAVCLALDGTLTDANPNAWTIVDGKLYLNYSMLQRTQWRIRSQVYVNLGDKEWRKILNKEKKSSPESAGSFRIAVMKPAFFSPGSSTPNPNVIGDLGGDIYKSIQERPLFSIAHADEPHDPSALGYLNRGGVWPFPPTNVKPNDAWQGEVRDRKPNLERLYRAGQELRLDALVMWFYKPRDMIPQWPVEVYVIDVENRQVYLRKGLNTGAGALVRQALDDFLTGRMGYRIAVMKPFSAIRPAPSTVVGDLGDHIYESIQKQRLFSIAYADEPNDPSALGALNRGGDWPFPPTNVAPDEIWQGTIIYSEPNLERLYQAGKELDIDAVVMWYFHAIDMTPEWPVEVYAIDVKKQRVYVHKGTNTEVSTLVQEAFSDFIEGRRP